MLLFFLVNNFDRHSSIQSSTLVSLKPKHYLKFKFNTVSVNRILQNSICNPLQFPVGDLPKEIQPRMRSSRYIKLKFHQRPLKRNFFSLNEFLLYTSTFCSPKVANEELWSSMNNGMESHSGMYPLCRSSRRGCQRHLFW